MELLQGLWHEGQGVRLVGVGVSGFDGGVTQLTLDDGAPSADEARRDRSALGRVTDVLRERYGEDAVGFGRDLRFKGLTSDTAPMNKSDF